MKSSCMADKAGKKKKMKMILTFIYYIINERRTFYEKFRY